MTDPQPHTPTATQIREDYAHLRYHFADGWSIGEERVQFDNWLTAEIAAAEQRGAVKALRDAADGLEPGDQHESPYIKAGRDIIQTLRYRADLLGVTMSDQQPHTPYIEDGCLVEPCEPDYAPGISQAIPGSWSKPLVDLTVLDGYDEMIAAAEQRGKEQGWDQCRDSIINAGRDHTEYSSNALDPGLTLTEFLDYTEKALANPYRANQLEVDDE